MKLTLDRYILIDGEGEIGSVNNRYVGTYFHDPEREYYNREGLYPKLYMTEESALKAAKQLRRGLVHKVKITYEIDEDYELPIELIIKHTKSNTDKGE